MVSAKRTVIPSLGAILAAILLQHIFGEPDVICRDPRTGSMAFDSSRKFLVYGRDNNEIHGLGNDLVFFPAAYYYAAFTGRDIILPDNALLGEVCKIVTCGFHTELAMSSAYPAMLEKSKLKNLALVNDVKMKEYIDGSNEMSAKAIVRGYGFEARSRWWNNSNSTKHCVHKLTGCNFADYACAEKHALQELIRGPFVDADIEKLSQRIKGIPDYWKTALLTLQHPFVPRMDAAVHFRNEFKSFEAFVNVSDPQYRLEVTHWLNSSVKQDVFQMMQTKLFDVITAKRREMNVSLAAKAYVYVSSDNEEVKERFIETLQGNGTNRPFEISPVRLIAPYILHVNGLRNKDRMTIHRAFFDIVFDWYAMSLCNAVLGWRKEYQRLVSSFAHSAQLMAGASVLSPPIGVGAAPGFQLRSKERNFRWEPYSV